MPAVYPSSPPARPNCASDPARPVLHRVDERAHRCRPGREGPRALPAGVLGGDRPRGALEHLAFYGVYINLGVYLTQTVGLSDKENGALLGLFALVRAWLPVGTGALADRLGFRRALLLSFAFYVLAYAALFAFPSRVGAWSAVFGMAFAGAFLKPVIPGAVRRCAPAAARPRASPSCTRR